MNTDETIGKLKIARRFLFEVSELEKKYGVKFLTVSQNTPTGDVIFVEVEVDEADEMENSDHEFDGDYDYDEIVKMMEEEEKKNKNENENTEQKKNELDWFDQIIEESY